MQYSVTGNGNYGQNWQLVPVSAGRGYRRWMRTWSVEVLSAPVASAGVTVALVASNCSARADTRTCKAITLLCFAPILAASLHDTDWPSLRHVHPIPPAQVGVRPRGSAMDTVVTLLVGAVPVSVTAKAYQP